MFKKKIISTMLAAVSALALAGAVQAQSKPAELKIGITTFISGPASVFGVPAKQAAELYLDDLNAKGGINGVKVVPTFIDEGVGGDKLLSEYRRVVQEQNVRVMLGSISSGSCNTLAPVAEDLKVLNILWDCGTEKVLEERRYKYVVRTQANATTEMVASVLYLLRQKPNFKTIAVVNQDYAWGRDSWELFSQTLKVLKPDVKVVAELFPKFGASDFSTEISRLQALRPDVILSTSWGGDLDTFVRQSAQRGLIKNSQFILPLAESSLERLGTTLPDGVIIGARGDHYFLHPELKDDPKLKGFVEKFKAKTGAYPIYSVYHMIQALDGLVAGYDKAIKANKGQWPSTEQLAEAMHGLKFRGLTDQVTIRDDGQGLEDQLLGTTRKVAAYPFPILDKIEIYPAEMAIAPMGQKSVDWVKTIKPEILKDARIKTYPALK
ncbi:ABC transporter substrate-binding protein [Herbaspirillum sp. AP02]|uniref:ABC transporter substrate-binding protein n=1 Tax=unclassified Herbaspirillum TaxID=2624150 RepID=UPI0015DAD97C|nr:MULTISPECIES: ABC transporter substrate-binding protein [unclassified Herbaspirillum]MBG7620001.1 ABC transporter substrate-binding protein [Herbaspirillum sp. AP02]NZD69253.1 ABC transporter substrate-binding protein [Herbaspirillum sp. AP21]